jgi:HAD superfamily hydrolase (TIGR01490 family)
MPAEMNLALFDLDNTLLPLDSDYEWGRFLARLGVVDGQAYERENQRFYDQYKAGTLDINAFLRFSLAPLAVHPVEQLQRWHEQFMREVIEPAILPPARRLVDEHRAAGHLCAVVTATNEFVTAPIARAFGVDHLVATGIERSGDHPTGQPTGRPRGIPCFRDGKIENTRQWLAGQGLTLSGCERSWFYSDSANDLPLLEQVSDPVATNPDARLAAQATERGWKILHLFE